MKKLVLPALAAALLPAAAARADVPAGTETITKDGLTATLSWDAGEFSPQHAALTITRDGAVAFQRRVPQVCGDEGCDRDPEDTDQFQFIDLDRDGERELFTRSENTGHCCVTIAVYFYDAASGTYSEFAHTWGDEQLYLENFDERGAPEIIASDDRFDALADSDPRFVPPRVFHFERVAGVPRLVDVTRSFPSIVRSDASFAKSFLHLIDKHDEAAGFARGLMASYVADEYLLGRGRVGVRELDRQIARGLLGGPRKAKTYRRRLLRLLSRYGYR
jgi:hypothetical protein